MCAAVPSREGYVPVGNTRLFYRDVGEGRPIVVLHGGPAFSHTYLLPDMDRLADSYRLIYYDQRGRGKSGGEAQEITVRSEIEDLESLRSHLGLERVVVLGHSWGGYLALEYAIHYPDRVSHLILMNTAPASSEDARLFLLEIDRRKAVHEQEWEALMSSTAYQEGDPQTVAAFYRLYFGTTVREPQHLERLMQSLSLGFTTEGILKGREIGSRLIGETWQATEFDLIPALRQLRTPTLIIHGEHDFIPVDTVARIAAAIPGARLLLLQACGHFSFIECPDEVRRAIDAFCAAGGEGAEPNHG